MVLNFYPKRLIVFALTMVLLAGFPGGAAGQTYTGIGGTIPDNGNTGTFYLNVLGVYPGPMDTIHGLEYVGINIAHPYDAELKIELVSPGGTKILLTEGFGYDGDNFTQTFFRDDAAVSVFAGAAPFTGDFRPVENIGYLNNGQQGNGTWQLRILDIYPGGNAGTLLNWSLKFSTDPGHPFPFDSSTLAIVMVDTYGQEIPDNPKIPIGLKIIDNPEGTYNHLTDNPAYDYYGGIETRGSSSQMFLKKSYGLETWDSSGTSIDTSLLGMPKESDWILNANFSDKSLMRNVMAYQTWMNMGHYATRYRFVEFFLNNRYKGVYIFSEKIKRDHNRVDIAKLAPSMNSGDSVTGGYLIKIDKTTGSGGAGWVSSFPPPVHPYGQFIWFQYEYPKSVDITVPQKEYIQGYMNAFETALAGPQFADTATGFRKYAVEETFVDYFLVNEFSKNVDGYRLSTFLHKERDSRGGKFRMGPVWDYDLAWHNADYCEGGNPQGWAYQFPCSYDYWQVPFWWARLLQDTLYANNVRCRWEEIRGTFLSNQAVENWIDSLALVLDEAQQRNFQCWPILGIYVWPNPYPYPTTYQDELAALKYWITQRFDWLDANMPGSCWTLSSGPEITSGRFLITPNPAGSMIRITGIPQVTENLAVEVLSLMGQRMLIENHYTAGQTVDISRLKPGSYILKVVSGAEVRTGTFIKMSE
jgi:subtilisin-like proprotein convertase family protein